MPAHSEVISRMMITQGEYSILQGETVTLPIEIRESVYAGEPAASPELAQLAMAIRFLRSGAKAVQLAIPYTYTPLGMTRGQVRDYWAMLRYMLSNLQEQREVLVCRGPKTAGKWRAGSSIVITRQILNRKRKAQ